MNRERGKFVFKKLLAAPSHSAPEAALPGTGLYGCIRTGEPDAGVTAFRDRNVYPELTARAFPTHCGLAIRSFYGICRISEVPDRTGAHYHVLISRFFGIRPETGQMGI